MKVFVPFCESLLEAAGHCTEAQPNLVPFSRQYACLRAMRPEIIGADGAAHPVVVPRNPRALDRLLETGSQAGNHRPQLALAEA